VSDAPGLEKLMEAHLAGIGRELKDIKDAQREGFQRIEHKMEQRDGHVDRELVKVHSRIDAMEKDSDERFTSLEKTVNRWGGGFALVVAIIVIGMPLVLWLLGLVVR